MGISTWFGWKSLAWKRLSRRWLYSALWICSCSSPSLLAQTAPTQPAPAPPASAQPGSTPLASPPPSAQDPQGPPLRTNTTVVLVPTLVTEQSGRPIYNLTVEDFLVQDNGVEQAIQMDESFDYEPVSLVVAVDVGHSAAPALERLKKMGSLLEPIVGNGKGEVAIVTFDSGVKTARDFTSNTDGLKDFFEHIKPGDSGSVILDAIHYSVDLLQKRPKDHRRVLLLLCGSHDDGSQRSVEEAVREIESSNTLIYSAPYSGVMSSINSKSDAAPSTNSMNLLSIVKIFSAVVKAAKENAPETVARLSGGEYLPFATEHGIEDRLSEMANHVHNLYLLSFQPRTLRPGQHALRVFIRGREDAIVYARTGYWATPNSQ